MAPRIYLRQPFPTQKDGCPLLKAEETPKPPPYKYTAAKRARPHNSVPFTSRVVGAKEDHPHAPISISHPTSAASAGPESQGVLGDKDVERKKTLATSIRVPSMNQKRTDNALSNPGAIPTATKPAIEPLGPTKSDTSAAQRPKFLLAKQEYQDLFASMAIGAKKPSIVPLKPRCPLQAEIIAEPIPSPPTMIEMQEEAQTEKSIPISNAVTPPLKYKFAAARPESHVLFASMKVGTKNTPLNSSMSVDLLPTKRAKKPVRNLSKAISKPLLPHQRTKNTFFNSSVSTDLPPTKRFEETAEELFKATSKQPQLPHQRTEVTTFTPESNVVVDSSDLGVQNVLHIEKYPPSDQRGQDIVPPRSSEFGKVAEDVTGSAVLIPKNSVTITKPADSAASQEYHDLFTSMAINPKRILRPVLTTSRKTISQNHTSPSTNSSIPPHSTTSTASPKTGYSSAESSPGSSPPRRRPQTTDLVARRLISAALGINLSMKKDAKTSVIQNAMKMKGRGQRLATWENYAACLEN